jgi:hypothetical protein
MNKSTDKENMNKINDKLQANAIYGKIAQGIENREYFDIESAYKGALSNERYVTEMIEKMKRENKESK